MGDSSYPENSRFFQIFWTWSNTFRINEKNSIQQLPAMFDDELNNQAQLQHCYIHRAFWPITMSNSYIHPWK